MNKYSPKTKTKKGTEEKKTGKKEEEEDFSQTGMQRFAETKVGGAVTSVFTGLVKMFSKDPLDETLRDPSNFKPLYIQQVTGSPVDARQLIKDFDPAKTLAERGR
ncbi:uncharacterized protein LOC122261955 [Penaeus japonicus]|uniref:uncharacterized protein LOC122261955 n=1 Tax=Penaeus japonicus TaxID=27405 RepID=UPI001C716772|nr:uncharacterized protein LOC122261955 [Penaeus japonicus]